MTKSIHPAFDSGNKTTPPRSGIWGYLNNQPKPGGNLSCKCSSNPIVVKIHSQVTNNHLCGCTQCWKPENSLFSQVALVARDKVEVTKNENKLAIVDESAPIQRHACSKCGTHMFGRVEDQSHHFYGFDFVHVELSKDDGWPAIQFAGFVSSIVESGTDASELDGIRKQITDSGLKAFDEFSPEINEFIDFKNSAKRTYKNQVL